MTQQLTHYNFNDEEERRRGGEEERSRGTEEQRSRGGEKERSKVGEKEKKDNIYDIAKCFC
jgi:hypothetical protein